MSKYILSSISKTNENNAGHKAGNDVLHIAQENGYALVPLFESASVKTRVRDVMSGVIATKFFSKKLKDGDIVMLQYPMNRTLMKHVYRIVRNSRAKIHLVTLIHDIDYLRDIPFRNKGVEGMKELELSLLGRSDYLICHNDKMIEALQKESLEVNFISLQLFDYLYDGKQADISENRSEIVVAGNLLESKAGYLYQLDDSKCQFSLSLYGSCFNEEHFHYKHAQYHGSFKPDELIENLKGAYGLVWDGPSTKTCDGSYGKYLRINNPHKVSLYIAAGLPVIIWKEAALCAFVEEQKIGFGVESLDNLDRELGLHVKDYETYLKNINELRTKVCRGCFLQAALEKIEQML